MPSDVLTGMRVFAAVVDAGSFAGAAEHLDLSRGMTSRYVADVEARLGVRLLNRTTRSLSLTEAGREYHARALEILALVERAESAAGRSAATPRGTLRVSAPTAFGRRILGPVVDAYLRRYPDVRLDLDLSDRMVDLVEEGLDLAIRSARQPNPDWIARPLAQARMRVCAAPKYLKVHGTPATPEALAEHNCLTYAYVGRTATWRLTRGGRGAAYRVSGNCRCNSGELLVRAAEEGLGIVYAPSFIIADALRARRLVPLLPAWDAETLSIMAVYANREYLPAKVRSLIDFLADWFERHADAIDAPA